MALQLRRGTKESRELLSSSLQLGELVYETDTKKLYIGDGASTSGINILSTSAGVGLNWNNTTQKLDVSSMNLTSGQITETTNKFFTDQRAQEAAQYLFTNTSTTHSGITFEYTAGSLGNNPTLNATVTSSLSADSAPELSGDLTLNGNSIVGSGSINYTGSFSNGSLSITSTVIDSGTDIIVVKSSNIQPLVVKATLPATVSTEADIPHIAISVSGHTSNALTSSSKVGGIMFKGLTGTANTFHSVGGMYATLIGTSNIDSAYPASNINIITGNKSETGFNTFIFDHNGALTAPIFKASSYTTGSYPGSIYHNEEAGWIIFDSQTSKFMGYNGSTWVILG